MFGAARLFAAWVLAAPPPAPPPSTQAPAPQKAGYWLSVDLIGPASARSEAAHALSADTSPRSPRDGRLRGEAIGHVDDIHAVIRWLEQHAFPPPAQPLALHPAEIVEASAPAIADQLRTDHGVQLRAMVVTGATVVGDRRPIDWPADGSRILPPDSTWHAAALLPGAAPLFAAPGSATPPASERFAMAYRRGDVFVTGTLDRCDETPPRHCMRWAQVVVRDGDRFIPGYIPAHQIAIRDAWRFDTEEHLPRAQLIRTGTRGSTGLLLLVARDSTGALHRKTVELPLQDGRFPAVGFTVRGPLAVLELPSGRVELPLDGSLDARPTPRADPAPTGTAPASEDSTEATPGASAGGERLR